MPPIPPSRFARLFAGLSPDSRRGFVAAIWEARGWETTTDDSTIVATRGDVTERVRIVKPGRFGTPALDDADVIVAVRNSDDLQTAATDAGVRYLTPADVRETLLYGLDRPTASALFEQTFDQPLTTTEAVRPTRRERAGAAIATVAETIEARADRRHLLALALIVVLVGAAVGQPGTLTNGRDPAAAVPAEPADAGTVGAVGAVGERTATPTAEAVTDGDHPAGLSERSPVNVTALADGHVDAVVGNARTLRVAASGPPEAQPLDGRTGWNYTARIERPRNYQFDARYQFPRDNDSDLLIAVSLYADGESKFRQRRIGNGITYQRYAIDTTGDASGYAVEVRQLLVLFLNGQSSRVECVGTLVDGGCFAYRVVVTGAPPLLPADATDYRAVAVVTDEGVVSSLHVGYSLPEDGEMVPVRFSIEYDDFGETTVSPPPWLSDAKNATGG